MGAFSGIEYLETTHGVPVKRAFANVAPSATDAPVVAAVPGSSLRVLALALMAGATATDATFTSKGAGAGTAISMKFACGANGGAVLGYCPHGWLQTNVGEGLALTTGPGSAVGVRVVYVEVPQ